MAQEIGRDGALIGLANAREDAIIEGSRGLAALMVLAAHYAHLFAAQTWLFRFATTGVDLFFVLSGFVFGPYLLGKPLPVLPHLVRRFFRLYPLYVAALIGYILLHEPPAQAWEHFPEHLLMLHTVVSKETAFYYNPAFWSLPPEVEFYLFLPLLATLSRNGWFAAVLGGSLLIHMALLLFPGSADFSSWPQIAGVHLPGLLPEFLLGGVAYAVSQRRLSVSVQWWLLLAGIGHLWLVAQVFKAFVVDAGVSGAVPVWIGGNIGLAAALGYAMVLTALSKLLAQAWGPATPLLLVAGSLSYGIYLFHNMMPALLRRLWPGLEGAWLALAALVFTIGMATLAHYGLERPLRNFGRQLSRCLLSVRS
ncbi:acyltransferase [Candidatus Accumulibacter cognatus]|uniref:Acyltransferase n=1 Tax=Candidatus Accumulibacter cognatus TaxID=2954383 RepID=A0A080MA85_9PROT|nr:acyltransferase [Candidatus Accumulibacter cognatus]KFB78207.1 MAG: Fucose 4-O-acetylase [Candidatus Accumulibacter cognatus]QLH50157.1 MAG: acyltransferase [Candidatus Accumulibacter cognatus]